MRFNRAFPEAMVTIPARRSIFTSKRIFPFRHWKPNLELGTSPGWLPIDDVEHTFTSEFRRHGYWTAQVSDNPHLGFTHAYAPFRRSFDHWKSIPGQAGTFKPASTVSLETVYEWLPPFLRDERYVPGMREYLANSGAGVREERDLRGARLRGGDRHARRGAPAPAVLHGRRLLRPARAVEPRREVREHVRRPGLQGREDRRHPLRLRAQLQRAAAARAARDLRGRGHPDRPLAGAVHGPLLRLGDGGQHDHPAALRSRLPARRARLHGQGAVAAAPRAGPGAVRDRAPRRPGGRRDQHLLHLDARRRADAAVAGRDQAAELDGGRRPLARARRRARPSRRATSTTAACTTASSSAPTTGC